jgi:penicillin-binding protein 2
VGKLGLERFLDNYLRGRSGTVLYEVDAMGRRLRKVDVQPGVPGLSVQTTLDPYISEILRRSLSDNKGAAVALDARTGEVLALVSSPAFNNQLLSTSFADSAAEQERREHVRSFFSNPQQLFFNRAVSGTYPPGSVFKMVTALAGLERKVLDAKTTVRDEGVLRVGDFSYANWYYTQYGRVEGDIALVRALARSNDIYFYKAAEWVGPVDLAEMARLFGFGQRNGIGITQEATGTVPDPDWKQQVIGEPWYLGNTYHFGIGQGDLLVTPLQIATMTQAIANKGTKCAPNIVQNQHLVRSGLPESYCAELGLAEEHIKLVLEGMLGACSQGGTASVFFSYNQAHRENGNSDPFEELEKGAVACKTGTAEFGMPDHRGYKKTHAWFTAIVGVDRVRLREQAELLLAARSKVHADVYPDASLSDTELWEQWALRAAEHGFPERLVVVVLVESDEIAPYKEGSREAAPIAKRLVDWIEQTPGTKAGEQDDLAPAAD